MHILLVGNPNCGKTTLFNALTGENQHVGNWPGVTVEKKTGRVLLNQHKIDITDLPGTYSLCAHTVEASQDERIAAEAIVTQSYDLIINVLDACHLERHLYLTSQLLELGKPLILAVNMTDIAEQRGISIDYASLSKQLGCSVVRLQANKKIGLDTLKDQLSTTQKPVKPLNYRLSLPVKQALHSLQDELKTQMISSELLTYYSWRILEGDCFLAEQPAIQTWLESHTETIIDSDIVLADARYQRLHELAGSVCKKQSDVSEHFTAKVDRIVLHRVWALPIFLGVMYCMFLFAINIGGALQDFFDISANTIFVQGSAWALTQIGTPPWLIAIIANGIGVGINTTVAFIPVIGAMFFFLALLETSGYMARAAFVVDKLMRLLGLPGKAFVPMIVGFGCNVPAIMAARTLDSSRDRLLTILMSPFMSCSARLAIYAVFVAAFFPHGGQNVVFALYLTGIMMAVLTGFLLRSTLLKGESSPLIIELPAYHRPSLGRLLRETYIRLRFFIIRAGRLIIPICVILGGLNALMINGSLSSSEASAQSLLSLIGQWLTPLFAPMGIHANNWPATVGLLTGMLAKEVVIGSLNSLYAQLAHLGQAQVETFNLWAGLKAALWSIPENLSELGKALTNPILASAPVDQLSQSVYGAMASRFDGRIGAFAYLLFVLLYIPCVSTMAVIRQEASKRWMIFAVTWSLLLAYTSAVFFYQLATIARHPLQSLGWISAMLTSIILFISYLYHRGIQREKRHVNAYS